MPQPILPAASETDTGAGAGLQMDPVEDASETSEVWKDGEETSSQSPGGGNKKKGKNAGVSSEVIVARRTSRDSSDDYLPPPAPCCACYCCRCDIQQGIANPIELDMVIKALVHLTLRRDVVVGGELISKKSRLLRIGRKWRRRGAWELNDDIELAAKERLQYCYDEEESVTLFFEVPRQHSRLWFIPIKCPCCVLLWTIICVAALCVVGIPPGISVDANFDSLMESDSQTSLVYNTMLIAMKDREKKERRLHSTETVAGGGAFPVGGVYDALQDAARKPTLDEAGHWHPLRWFSKLVLGQGHREYGPLIARNDSRRLATNLYKRYQFFLTYATKDPSTSILSNSFLDEIHRIENELKALPEWSVLCDKAEPSTKSFCSPGVSFVNIVFASRTGSVSSSADATTLTFDGEGTEPLPLEIALDIAKERGILPLVFPFKQTQQEFIKVESLPCYDLSSSCALYKSQGHCTPFAEHNSFMQDFCTKTCNLCGPSQDYTNTSDTSVQYHVVDVLRSSFRFDAFCCTSADANPAAGTKMLEETWAKFIETIVNMVGARPEGEALRVLYSGDSIEGYEAQVALFSDFTWAGASYAFVMLYATLHTRSLILSMIGLFLVMLAIPSALAVFALASGSESVSLFMCLSVFMVIGIGSDMLFVYTDFWKQSLDQSRDPVLRLKYTYLQAATSTAATTFTTAMSFFANLASVLRPLREFGFFMGACVVIAWIIIGIGYPPVLIIGEKCHRRLSRSAAALASRQQAHAGTQSVGLRRSVSMSTAVSQLLDPERKGVGDLHQNNLAGFSNVLRDWKCSVVLGVMLLTLGCVGLAGMNVEQASGAPQMFPADHNQVVGKLVNTQFMSFDDDLARTLAGFSSKECKDLFNTGCSQYRCESIGLPLGTATDCECLPHPWARTGDCENPAKRRMEFRVLGREGMPTSAIAAANWTQLLEKQFPSALDVTTSISPRQNKCLAENWEGGQQTLAVMVVAGTADITLRESSRGSAPKTCIEKQVCYCGVARCEGSDFKEGYGSLKLKSMDYGFDWDGRRLAEVQTPASQHPLADARSGRQLQGLKPEDYVDVSVVFGLNVVGSSPLLGMSQDQPWEYNLDFDLQDPWAQRRLEHLCKTMGDEKELEIYITTCWLLGFAEDWIAKGKDWPVRPTENINTEIQSYAATHVTNEVQTTTFLWSEGAFVRACSLMFILTKPKQIASSEAMLIRLDWDKYFEAFNSQAEKAVKGAWHASKLWVTADAEQEILSSTMDTLLISLGCVFLGVVIFTTSVHLAFLVMIVVVGIIMQLVFFMVVMMSWPVGAIEVLSLIIFVGYATTYCLHVAHKYHTCHINSVHEEQPEEEVQSIASESPMRTKSSRSSKRLSTRSSARMDISDKKPKKRHSKIEESLLMQNRSEERFSRTAYALGRVGPAIIGSAITTAGCAAFLLPCQLAVFTKIGAVVIAVTLFAIIYTVVPLPALLMLCGPCGHDCQALFGCLTSVVMGGIKRGATHELEPLADRQTRRYVLHMPTRAMGSISPGFAANRTRIIANG